MNRFLQAALIATTAIAALPAQAATPITLDFTNASVKQVEAKTSPIAGDWNGNTRTFTYSYGNNESLNVKATAWHRNAENGDYNSVNNAYLGWWTGNANVGLGVTARNEDGGSNSHTIDNYYGWDFVVLQFDKSVSLTNGVFNPYQLEQLNYKDNDAFIAVDTLSGPWNQALSITSWSQFSAGFDKSINTSGDGVVASQKIDMTGRSGNMWVIGASIDGPDALNDAFKLGQLTVTVVPEPATWAMMLVGFGMVAAAARYRRRRTSTAIA